MYAIRSYYDIYGARRVVENRVFERLDGHAVAVHREAVQAHAEQAREVLHPWIGEFVAEHGVAGAAEREQRREHVITSYSIHYTKLYDIGAGAHGKLTLLDGNAWEVRRQMRWKQPKQYLAGVAEGRPLQDEFSVPAADLPFEFMMNALRLIEGFDPALFEARTAQLLLAVETILRRAEDEGLLVRESYNFV